MRSVILWIALAAAQRLHAQSPCAVAPAVANDVKTGNTLRDLSQQLLDAVGRGDTAVWSRTLDGAGVFVDEEGNARDKRTVLSELRPLPPYMTGHICVTNPRATVSGSVAVLTYDAMETATYYGQPLRTRYHTTDTYIRRGSRWFLFGEHASVLPAEHTAVAVRPESLNEFVGSYRMAEGVDIQITREGDHLFSQRTGGRREELLPLGVDRFFRVGARRGERIFRRNGSGQVDALLDRRDNIDLIWARVRP